MIKSALLRIYLVALKRSASGAVVPPRSLSVRRRVPNSSRARWPPD